MAFFLLRFIKREDKNSSTATDHSLSASVDIVSVQVLLSDDIGAGAGLDWKTLEGESSSLIGSRTALSLSFPVSCASR
jgi:hypothetical protein